MRTDHMEIEILKDGTIKFTTDSISGPNHVSADKFLADVEDTAGVPAVIESRKGTHTHTHQHHQAHEHRGE